MDLAKRLGTADGYGGLRGAIALFNRKHAFAAAEAYAAALPYAHYGRALGAAVVANDLAQGGRLADTLGVLCTAKPSDHEFLPGFGNTPLLVSAGDRSENLHGFLVPDLLPLALAALGKFQILGGDTDGPWHIGQVAGAWGKPAVAH